jgi:hypothetical protein
VADNKKEKDKDDDILVETEVEEKKSVKAEAKKSDLEIETEDDTPEVDRNRTPLAKDIVEALDKDELTEFDGKVKDRMVKLKRVWHDERREKEREQREKNEALRMAQHYKEQAEKLAHRAAKSDDTLLTSVKGAADLELSSAKKAFKEAYESGDAEALAEAQAKLSVAANRVEQLKNYRPQSGQEKEKPVERKDEAVRPRLDPKTVAWQQRNTWWGTDDEMTATALGLHQKIEKQYGADFVGTDKYWSMVDDTMKRRFPEYFGDDDKPDDDEDTDAKSEKSSKTGSKPAAIVAPVTRSTSSQTKVVLKQSQLNIAKRLGLTPEQYAREQLKLQKAQR